MGKPGKKNVPITQRAEVKTNSKNKVEEPLLNVGPAGVYGNNETRKIPAPAKQLSKKNVKATAKQTAKQKKFLPEAILTAITKEKQGNVKAPAKQKKTDNKVTNTEILKTTSAGKDITVKGKEITKGRTDKETWKDNVKGVKQKFKTFADYQAAASGYRKKKGKDFKADQVGTGKFEKDTTKKGKKETNTTSSTETVRVRDTGDAQTALSRRQTIRGGKVGTRVEMQGKVKAARAKYKNMTKAEKDAEGGRIKYMRKIKNEAKEVRANKNSKLGAAAAKGAQAQADQNKSSLSGQTSNVKSAGRDEEKSDTTKKQQAAAQAKKLEAAAALAADKKAKAAAALLAKKQEDNTITDIKAANAQVKMAPGFFKNKSALKMGYFKNK